MKSKSKPRRPKATPEAAAAIPKPTGWPRWQWVLLGMAALLIAYALYAPALQGPFLFDDLYLPYTRSESERMPLRDWTGNVRPALMVTFWLNYRFAGLETYSYHVTNVFLHAMAAVLVFLILRRLLRHSGHAEESRDGLLALAGAAVFLVHPVQTEAVAYIASRSDILSTLAAYGALCVFLYRRREALTIPAVVAVLALVGIATLSKEQGVAIVPVLLLADYFWHPGFTLQGIWRNWKLYLPMVAGGLALTPHMLVVIRYAGEAGFGMKDLKWHEYGLSQFRVIWHYIRLLILPVGLNLDPALPVSRSIWEHGAWAGAFGLAVVVAAAWWFRRSFPLAVFGVLAFFVLIAPTSSVMPIRDLAAERRLYFPMIGFLAVVCGLLQRWKVPLRQLAAGAGVLVLALGWGTRSRAELYGDPIALWRDTAAKSPGKSRAHFQLAYAYYEAGRCQQASEEFELTSKLQRPDVRLLLDWALALDCAGDPERALARLRQAAELEPNVNVQATIGMIHGKQGQYEQALSALAEAKKIDPGFAMTYVYEGNVHAAQGGLEKARELYGRALQLDPRNPVAVQAAANLERRLGARP